MKKTTIKSIIIILISAFITFEVIEYEKFKESPTERAELDYKFAHIGPNY